MGAPIVHFEFWSEDPDRASEFYKQVFDWQIRHIPEIDYHLVDTEGGGINGGIMKPKQGPWPSNLSLYIQVDDVEAYREKIIQGGGKIITDTMEIPNVGTFALFADPDGRVLGIWKKLPEE